MTADIAADLREAATAALRCSFDHSIEHPSRWRDLADRLEALADAVEAKDPTAWGMVHAGSFKVDGSWRFPTATETQNVAN